MLSKTGILTLAPPHPVNWLIQPAGRLSSWCNQRTEHNLQSAEAPDKAGPAADEQDERALKEDEHELFPHQQKQSPAAREHEPGIQRDGPPTDPAEPLFPVLLLPERQHPP